VREAGKSLPNAISEVREAVDFLRYYGARARSRLRSGHYQPLGPVVCMYHPSSPSSWRCESPNLPTRRHD